MNIRHFFIAILAVFSVSAVKADDLSNRFQIGTGLLYEKGLDLTLSYEHETRYHSSWEYFANAYLKWADCPNCHHICPESFWNNYNTWSIGAAYKPCVLRGRNHHANFRFGGSLGSDRDDVIGGIHIGYEHSYALKGGWQLGWQVKTDAIINGKDLFRTGVVLFVKLPVSKYNKQVKRK